MFANRVAESVRDKQIPSGQREVVRVIQPQNQGTVDRCPRGGVVFAIVLSIVLLLVAGMTHTVTATAAMSWHRLNLGRIGQ